MKTRNEFRAELLAQPGMVQIMNPNQPERFEELVDMQFDSYMKTFNANVERHAEKIEIRYEAAIRFLERIGSAYPHEHAKAYALGFDR